MDEKQRNFSRESDKDSHISTSSDTVKNHERDHETSEASQQAESSDRYYYAYGPYQSVKQDETSCATTSTEPAGRTNNEQVTLSTSVKPKPLSFSSVTQQGSFAVPGKRGGEADSSTPPKDGWNFEVLKRPNGTSFKVILASFMAGMLVITTLMIIADRMNLFTGDKIRVGQEEAAKSAISSNIIPANSPRIPFPNGANSVADVVEKVSPAVVKIETFAAGKVNQGRGRNLSDDPLQEFYDHFFGNGSGNESSRQNIKPDLQKLGTGSGFIFHKEGKEGFILTNQHVIEHGELIRVIVKDQKEPLKAELLGHSKELDLAVLKIKSDRNLSTASLGNSDVTRIGEQIIAIGNPIGLDHTVTVGVLSARGRDVNDNDGTRNYRHLLQTDASINQGNSGGPLLNMKGEVIGMNVLVARPAQGIGFAISSNEISKVVNDLKNKREIPKEPEPFIGVGLWTMTDILASELGMDFIKGSLVREVYFSSPAYEADLRGYDIITGMDGTKYATSEELIEQIKKRKVGDNVTLQVVRKGKAIDIPVKIGDKNKLLKQSER